MKESKNILIVHNKYRQRGGEDIVVENETKLLKDMGYNVFEYIRSNDELNDLKLWKKILLPVNTIFSFRSYCDVLKIIRENDIDIMHVHNTVCMISPSVYYAGFKSHIPVFQTVHNFRLLCPAGLFLRRGEICTECAQKGLHISLLHKCYRESFSQTLLLCITLMTHRLLGTYNKLNYICLSEFNKNQIMKLNSFPGVKIPSDQFFVKPNFIEK